jgi:hypothetical protein
VPRTLSVAQVEPLGELRVDLAQLLRCALALRPRVAPLHELACDPDREPPPALSQRHGERALEIRDRFLPGLRERGLHAQQVAQEHGFPSGEAQGLVDRGARVVPASQAEARLREGREVEGAEPRELDALQLLEIVAHHLEIALGFRGAEEDARVRQSARRDVLEHPVAMGSADLGGDLASWLATSPRR